MTTSYFNRTGVLRFYGTARMTPVLTGLFGAYAPQSGSEDLESITLQVTTEGMEPTWEEVGSSVALALEMAPCTGAADALMELATLYGGEAMGIVAGIVERFDDSMPNFYTLFALAIACNDGHALRSIDVEGGWATPGPGHGHCGGDSVYVSEGVHVAVSTTLARDIGCRLEQAIAGGSEEALEDAFWLVETLIAGGVKEAASRGLVRAKLSAFLLRPVATEELSDL